MITTEQLTIARLEREQLMVMKCVSSLLDSIALMIPHVDVTSMRRQDVITMIQSQKKAVEIMNNLIVGE